MCNKHFGLWSDNFMCFSSFIISRPCLVVGDPQMIREIFVKNFNNFDRVDNLTSGNDTEANFLTHLHGKEWKRARTIVSHTFTAHKLKLVFGNIKTSIDSNLDRLKNISRTTEKFNPGEYFPRSAFDILAKSCFSIRLNTFDETANRYMEAAHSIQGANFFRGLLVSIMPASIVKKLKLSITDSRSLNLFSQLINRALQQRTPEASMPIYDYLQLLVDTRLKEIKNRSDAKPKNSNGSCGLSDQEIITHSISLLVAGFDNISS